MTMIVSNAALNAHAKAIRALGKQTVESVIEIGRHLTEAKAEVKKLGGSWGDWLKTEFDWRDTSARRFMDVYERKSELAKLANQDLPLASLYLLAAPSTSKAARDEVAAKAKKGRVKHKEVVTAVRTHKSSAPKQPKGLQARIIELVKAAPDGLTTEQIQAALPDAHKQTVNSQTNGLKKKGWLRYDGKRRKGKAIGGRPAEVYVYDPNPTPRQKSGGKPTSVVDFGERKLVAMIADGSICKVIEAWAQDKARADRVTKAYQLIMPLVGDGPKGIRLLDEEMSRLAFKEGRAITLGAFGKL